MVTSPVPDIPWLVNRLCILTINTRKLFSVNLAIDHVSNVLLVTIFCSCCFCSSKASSCCSRTSSSISGRNWPCTCFGFYSGSYSSSWYFKNTSTSSTSTFTITYLTKVSSESVYFKGLYCLTSVFCAESWKIKTLARNSFLFSLFIWVNKENVEIQDPIAIQKDGTTFEFLKKSFQHFGK